MSKVELFTGGRIDTGLVVAGLPIVADRDRLVAGIEDHRPGAGDQRVGDRCQPGVVDDAAVDVDVAVGGIVEGVGDGRWVDRGCSAEDQRIVSGAAVEVQFARGNHAGDRLPAEVDGQRVVIGGAGDGDSGHVGKRRRRGDGAVDQDLEIRAATADFVRIAAVGSPVSTGNRNRDAGCLRIGDGSSFD